MRYVLLLTLTLVLVAVQVPPSAHGAGFVVTATGDGGDSNTADGVCNDGSGACTLRAAIEEANASAASDEVTFNIPGAGVHLITPGATLPPITEPVSIDATTQPGYAGKPLVQLDGANAGPDANGIAITAGASLVRGLSITGFSPHGIALLSGAGNTIQGNYIGVEPDGVTANGNGVSQGNGDGIRIEEGALGGHTIGGTLPTERNVISGNLGAGIGVLNDTGSVITGNFIGTDASGTLDIGNGVGIVGGDLATGHTIGGTATGAGNLISSNDYGGIMLFGSENNTIQGNLIGTDVTGSTPLGNGENAVWLYYAHGNLIGGNAPGARNIISANQYGGIVLHSSNSNTVLGNYIGTDQSGILPLGNGGAGVYIFGMSGYPEGTGNIIGGPGPNEGNLVAYNGYDSAPPGGAGVLVQEGAAGNPIRGNSIHDNAQIGIDNWVGGNLELAPPVITGLGPLSGTSLPDCTIDVYSDAADEGGVFYGSTTADGAGNWTYGAPVGGPNLTATCTDSAGNTSEFSAPFASGCAADDDDCEGVVDASDNCPQRANPAQEDADADGVGDACDAGPSGDVDCSTAVNSIDALKVLRHSAGLPVQQNEPCVDIGLLTVSGWERGNVNCSASVNSVDGLLILRDTAGLSATLPAGCPPINNP